MDSDKQQQHHEFGPPSESPASPAASFFRRSSAQRYSPLSPISLAKSYNEIPKRNFASSPSQSSNSINTTDSNATGRSTPVPGPQYILGQPSPRVENPWGIRWWTPFSMIGLFVLGVVSAISHHAFYSSLHGREAENQLEKIRYGTAMAVFTKATLVGSVVVGYRQRIWYTLRRKTLSLGGIDSLFAVADDPTMFLEKDMIINAKVVTTMAVAVWLIPLAAVLTPASLTTNLVVVTNTTTCPSVLNLNFSAESYNNYRNPPNISGYPGTSLSYFNTTDHTGKTPDYFDYWDQPSKNALRLATMSRYWRRPIQREGASVLACGLGWNCTYSVSFTGPGYKCTESASGVDSNTAELAEMGAPFNTRALAPAGSIIYQAVVDQGDYASPQAPSNNGEPVQKPPPPDLGTFKSEPVLWIGYTVNTNESYPPGSPYLEQWKTVKIPKIFKCEHYETRYDVLFNHTDGQQSTIVKNRTFLHPIVDTSLTQLPNGTPDPSDTGPTSNWVRPNTDVPHYKLTAAYHSLGSLIRLPLNGTIEWIDGVPTTHSDVSETRLIDQHNFFPIPNIQNELQSYYEDLILTLLSNPNLIVGASESVPCTKSRHANLFYYHIRGLWPAYTIVIGVSLSFLVVGLLAMYRNGVDSDTCFSRIVATTRNRTLDRLSRGACLGGGKMPEEFMGARLRFGELVEEGAWEGEGAGVRHCAFGTEDQVRPIIEGRVYAGLREGDWVEKTEAHRGLDEERTRLFDGGHNDSDSDLN
ncbi:MAG: hypothetical protein M1813_008863 [Trichoglossum hirsutum]|nr:MAG: hypothetical protein M1813_008863 [Trichoglossum hirsutum]